MFWFQDTNLQANHQQQQQVGATDASTDAAIFCPPPAILPTLRQLNFVLWQVTHLHRFHSGNREVPPEISLPSPDVSQVDNVDADRVEERQSDVMH